MSKDDSSFVKRVKSKTKKLQRALERELDEYVRLGQCRDWISTVYGFQSYDDLFRQYHDQGFAFDEFVSEAELRTRRSAQIRSLAFDFDLSDEMARRIVDEIRPTSARVGKSSGCTPDQNQQGVRIDE